VAAAAVCRDRKHCSPDTAYRLRRTRKRSPRPKEDGHASRTPNRCLGSGCISHVLSCSRFRSGALLTDIKLCIHEKRQAQLACYRLDRRRRRSRSSGGLALLLFSVLLGPVRGLGSLLWLGECLPILPVLLRLTFIAIWNRCHEPAGPHPAGFNKGAAVPRGRQAHVWAPQLVAPGMLIRPFLL
jgi:hypothetical protein